MVGERALRLVLASVLVTACAPVGTHHAVPLYPHQEGQRLPPEQVAVLHGPVGAVDGVEVVHGVRTFELLPACHIVTMRTDVGAAGPEANGAWAATFPPLVVAFRMRAAHVYTIEVDIQESSAPVSRVTAVARERGPAGARTRVAWASSQRDLDECRRWMPTSTVEK